MSAELAEPRHIMEPAQVLYELDRFGIRYKLHKGVFVTEPSMYLNDPRQCLTGLKYALEYHADTLAEMLPGYDPVICGWCYLEILRGKHRVRVYAQEEGRRYSFHQECHLDRQEKHPHLPQAEILLDMPGYTVLIEDSGLCCYCQMQEAELPEDAPNVCPRCWRKQEAKKLRVA